MALDDDNNMYIGGSFNTGLLNSVVIPSAIDTKFGLNHDAYDVYVNERYIGKKTLLVQDESIGDVDDFLHSRGFTEFTSSLDGDHYQIRTEGDDEQEIVNHIEVYLQNR